MSGRRTWRVLGMVLIGCIVPPGAHARTRRTVPRKSVHAVPRSSMRAVRSEPLSSPRPEVERLALTAYACGRPLFAGRLLTIIDYSLPSTERRLWVIDVPSRRVVFNELVAHGAGSGENYAAAFSNQPGSRQSSLGLFRTEDVYLGEHGESLHLSGLEPGFNDRAMERAIAMHGAAYVSREAIVARGQLGRSWGCPALERGVERRVIEQIKGGTALFVYYPDPHWLAGSRFLRCGGPTTREAAESVAMPGAG